MLETNNQRAKGAEGQRGTDWRRNNHARDKQSESQRGRGTEGGGRERERERGGRR